MPVKQITTAVLSALVSWDGLCHSSNPAGDYPSPTSPRIFYTDIVAGPTSGGENDLGCYLSIYGINFGAQADLGTTTKVYVGTAEVANYRALVAAKPAAGFPGIALQHIAVQVGALGGLAPGVFSAVRVRVNGEYSNADFTFTNQPGPIIFVDEVNGNDANPGTMAAPKKYMQTIDGSGFPTGGALNTSTVPGSYFVLRGGPYSSNLGKDASWFRFWRITGAPVTGAANAGYITVTAYPGPILGHAIEDVHFTCPASSKCIEGNDTARAQETTPWGFVGYSKYVVISNLHIEVSATSGVGSAPINLQTNADYWRVVNNELGPWPTTTLAQAGGIAGNGEYTKLLGNYIHDIGGLVTQKENHGIYLDGNLRGSQNIQVAYNYITDIPAGNTFQTYTPYGVPHFGLEIFNNVFQNSGKHGINLADSTLSARVWNNVVRGCVNAALRFNTSTANLDIEVHHNTFYDGYGASTGFGMVQNDWNAASGHVMIADNIFVMGATRTNNTLAWYYNNGTGTAISFANNLYYDPKGVVTTKYSGDATGTYGNPGFRTAYTDMRIYNTSPAANQSTPVTYVDVPTLDINNKLRPLTGNTYASLGAYEAEVAP